MSMRIQKLRKILVANRGEIAIRIFRAATELGLKTVAVYSREDRFALHRFKADEAYLIGENKSPVKAYLDIDQIIKVAKESKADCIHPGYGFLSENPDFAQSVIAAGIKFIGPSPRIMKLLGNKIESRKVAENANVPVVPATGPLPQKINQIASLADQIGYPLMLKASWGGGGRGMRIISNKDELSSQVSSGKRESYNAFGNDEVYFEKFLEQARHVEVQILGDLYGNIVHLFERDCSMQRRNQKIVERAPADYLDGETRKSICDAAVRLCKSVDYFCAGTVEFLMNFESRDFYFIEVNPRIQVEHTVTEEITGIDLIKAQIRVTEGYKIGDEDNKLPEQKDIKINGHALQCRVTTEDPENKFIPDYGRITAYRGATGFGIRLDGGTAYSGAVITSNYDSLLEKVTAWAPTSDEAVKRMDRAIREYRIRGVKTNLIFLEGLISHKKFKSWNYTTRFIDSTPELFEFPKRRDRATRLLSFLAETLVNENEEISGRLKQKINFEKPVIPTSDNLNIQPGTKDIFLKLGPEEFSKWILKQERLLITDTTFRDAHQSLLATRVRTHDMLNIAPYYAQSMSNLFSVECWGGATFDVAMRFLNEDPWDRIIKLRELLPNILTQMLLRSSNAVGYKNYPDNVVQFFIKQSAQAGVDIFRIFDCLNWIENMQVAIEAVCLEGKICEGAICYSGDLSDPNEHKYTLKYYIQKAKKLESLGVHILGIKDMAGLCKPSAAKILISALKNEINIPVHFHTHDTSGIAAASILAASEAGVDAVDAAVDSMSGLTSQPNLGSIVEALNSSKRDTLLDKTVLRMLANYWEIVRKYYTPFESDLRSGMAEVYEHAMPGGQYTNLKEQARSVGIESSRWPEVSKAYSEVNRMFGNIVKVTPTSKVVGDMAIFMVTNNYSVEEILDPNKDINFPESVIELMRGDLGFPEDGWPMALQNKILKNNEPLKERPGASLQPVNFDKVRKDLEKKISRQINDYDLASYLMYPRVFLDYSKHRKSFSDVSVLPTKSFFYGPEEDEEILVNIDKGKTLIIRLLAIGEPNHKGYRNVFFELNGQPRTVSVLDKRIKPKVSQSIKADTENPSHIFSPMPGLVVKLLVSPGEEIKQGQSLLTIESMKMETTIHSEISGKIEEVLVESGARIDAKDLLMKIN